MGIYSCFEREVSTSCSIITYRFSLILKRFKANAETLYLSRTSKGVINMVRVRIPQITNIEVAIQLYYERLELSNADIEKLFGKHSSTTIAGLKAMAREKMCEDNVPCWNAQRVNTEAAYSAWGLSIDDLERRYHKLTQFKQLA